MKKTKELKLINFYVLMAIINFNANLVHPVTPKFFRILNYPDYMFGVSFALMSLGSFLLSPMWANLSKKYGYSRIMALGIFFYGVGQLFFCTSRNIGFTVFARLFAGIFSSAMNVATILLLSNRFEIRNKNDRLATGVAIQVCGGAIGYFVGGYIGNYIPSISFYTQIVLCCIISTYILFKIPKESTENNTISFSDINPFKSFIKVKYILSREIIIFFAITLFVSFAFVSFESCFNYFLKRIYDLDPIYNGIIKGTVAIIAICLNMTINKKIISTFNAKSIIKPYIFIGAIFIISLIITNDVNIFIFAAVLYYVLDSITKPVMQIIGTKDPLVYGAYNSVTYLGNVTGSFSAGLLFTINSKLPFIVSFIFIIFAFLLTFPLKKVRD